MDKYGIQEQINLLQNAKTAREISERADYFTLIIKENEALKKRLERAEMSFTLAVGTMRYNFAGHTLIKEGYKEMIDAIIEINRIGDEEIYEFFEKEAEAKLREIKGEKD